MSKSKGNVAYPEPIARTLGTDALRYYLLRDVSFGQDGNFSHDALVTRYNSDLANGLGNLASRTLSMIERYCEGRSARAFAARFRRSGKRCSRMRSPKPFAPTTKEYEELSFSRALETIWSAVAQVDGYLTAQKPWTLAAEDPDACACASIRCCIAPPNHCASSWRWRIRRCPRPRRKSGRSSDSSARLGEFRLDQLAWGGLRPGTSIGELAPVFPRSRKI